MVCARCGIKVDDIHHVEVGMIFMAREGDPFQLAADQMASSAAFCLPCAAKSPGAVAEQLSVLTGGIDDGIKAAAAEATE